MGQQDAQGTGKSLRTSAIRLACFAKTGQIAPAFGSAHFTLAEPSQKANKPMIMGKTVRWQPLAV